MENYDICVYLFELLLDLFCLNTLSQTIDSDWPPEAPFIYHITYIQGRQYLYNPAIMLENTYQ